MSKSCAPCHPFSGQPRPDTGMNPGDDKVKWNDSEPGEQVLNKRLTPCPMRSLARPVYTVQQFRGSNRRQSDVLFCLLHEQGVQLALPSLDSNQDTRVDQYSHGDSDNTACCTVTASTVSQ